ncbi:MAG TPA: type 1 glutamine amidotransferase, partial [Candidatus Limnocylindrales bacterium]|nr:type 1 glutamine amidotransferase [Candidatus Limnocylindrales bacterium]
MNALVLQHLACETPGVFEDVLRERGAQIHRVELDEGDPLPDWRAFDAIVAMGGPMSVNDEADHPWLKSEKRLIADAVEAGTPYWGVCLGVQLLASSLGARVYKGRKPEVGLYPVTLTEAARTDPVFQAMPGEFLTMQWHGDTFDLPAGAVRLAASSAYPNQSFRWRNAYGVQFHLESSAEAVRSWAAIPEYVEDLERTLGPGSAPGMLEAVAAAADQLRESGR